jgi:addiction module HigA family antidote
MGDTPGKIGIKPSHPGAFIREEILEPLDLSVARAAEVLGVRRATLSDLVNGNSGNGAQD